MYTAISPLRSVIDANCGAGHRVDNALARKLLINAYVF
jgi:hypothetical protein